jgi:hypothetical protein
VLDSCYNNVLRIDIQQRATAESLDLRTREILQLAAGEHLDLRTREILHLAAGEHLDLMTREILQLAAGEHLDLRTREILQLAAMLAGEHRLEVAVADSEVLQNRAQYPQNDLEADALQDAGISGGVLDSCFDNVLRIDIQRCEFQQCATAEALDLGMHEILRLAAGQHRLEVAVADSEVLVDGDDPTP